MKNKTNETPRKVRCVNEQLLDILNFCEISDKEQIRYIRSCLVVAYNQGALEQIEWFKKWMIS